MLIGTAGAGLTRGDLSDNHVRPCRSCIRRGPQPELRVSRWLRRAVSRQPSAGRRRFSRWFEERCRDEHEKGGAGHGQRELQFRASFAANRDLLVLFLQIQ